MSDKWDFIVIINDESDPVDALVIPIDRTAGGEPKWYRDYRAKMDSFGERNAVSGVFAPEDYESFAIWLVDELFKPKCLLIEVDLRWTHDEAGPYMVVLDGRLI